MADAVHRPDADDRSYRIVDLPNDLRVLLISDPRISAPKEPPARTAGSFLSWCSPRQPVTIVEPALAGDSDDDSTNRMAACALCVGVGYLADPAHLGGCAHYVEHMAFMGTREYPEENGWSKFLSRHGGDSNAETDAETTVFYFDVHPAHLRATLRRFGSFFSCPLFKWSGSRREVQAIHQEFEQAAQNDAVRQWQILSSLVQSEHPYHRFGWGNKRSLVDEPKKAALDVRAELLAFHSRYYSANLMTGVIIGREPLETLQEWALEAFGLVANRAIERPRVRSDLPPMAPAALPLIVHVTPLEQSRTLTLYWYLPAQVSAAHLASRPTDFVGHLLGHEGQGSVLMVLKRNGWATELYAGITSDGDSTAAAALFAVGVDLTLAGVERVDEVVAVVCGYLGLLARGPPPESLYQELRDVAAISFRFMEREPEIDYARRLALSMQKRLPATQTLSSDVLYGAYFPTLVAEVIAAMTPDRVLIALMIKQDDQAEGSSPTSPGTGAQAAAAVAAASGPARSATTDGPGHAVAAAPPSLQPGGRQPQRIGGRCECNQGEDCGRSEHQLRGARSDVLTETWFGSTFQTEKVTPAQLALWGRSFELGRQGNATTTAEAPKPADPMSTGIGETAVGAAVAMGVAMECDVELTVTGEDLSPEALVGSLHLPLPNKFIPTDFSLRHPKRKATASPAPPSAPNGMTKLRTLPVLLHSAPGAGALFFKADDRFSTPKAVLWLSLERPRRRLPTLCEALLASLAVDMTLDALQEASYAATVAGLDYELSASVHGFTVSAAGFSHKLASLALRVCAALAHTLSSAACDATLFERAKQRLALTLSNAGHMAAECAREARLELIEEPHFTPSAQLEALCSLTPADLNSFVSAAGLGRQAPKPPCFVTTVLACGNLAAEEALDFYREARATLHLPLDTAALLPLDTGSATSKALSSTSPATMHDSVSALASAPAPTSAHTSMLASAPTSAPASIIVSAPASDAELALEGCVVLPNGSARCYRVASTNAAETSHAVELYWQLGPLSHGLAARLELLVHLMEEPLFDQLRTKEQLGYSVACGSRQTRGLLGFAITLTSAHASPCKLEARSLRFVGAFVRSLARMTPAVFGANVEAAVANKLRDDVNLSDEARRLVGEIASEQFVFDRAECEVAEMRKITHAELVVWARQVLLQEEARRLSVHAYKGCLKGAVADEPLPLGAIKVTHAREFRAPLAVHHEKRRALPTHLLKRREMDTAFTPVVRPER